MAQPPTYTRQYNFNDYSTSNPSTPHLGSKIDLELDTAKTTLDALKSNLGVIQRDDGKLRNLSVHTEALSNAVLTLIKATENGYGVKGSWAASTAYAVGDLVESSQATYLCFEAHTSGLTFGANSSKFILLANAAIQTTASAVDTLSGDGTTTTFTLTNNSPSGVTDVLVFVNGSLRTPTTDYTIPSNTQITFQTAPSNATNNVIVWGTSTVVEAAKAAAQSARDTAETHRDDANEHKITANSWANHVEGTVIDIDSTIDSNEYSAKAYAIAESTPTTIYVTVPNGKFAFNGKTILTGSESLYNVIKGSTYTFDVSDTTNNGHQLEFSTSAEDATPDYTVTRNGTPGQSGATVSFAVPANVANTIYFYCSTSGHTGMGATLSAIAESYAPSVRSAKEWASKTDGEVINLGAGIGSEYSSKMYAQETSGDHSHGGSSRGWAQTAKNTQVPGASSTDRSAKHYSEVAADHKTDAESAKTAAETALDSFDDRYLGSKTVSSHPALDNDGNSLLTGALYWNTGSGGITQGMYVYNGSSWDTLRTSVGGDTVTSSSGNNLNLVTPSNSNNVIINSGSNSIQLPNVRASQDNYVLAMTDKTTGETAWQVTSTAPTVLGVTSGQLNTAETLATRTGTTTSGSTTISAISTTNLVGGEYVYGDGIPANTTISSISQASTSTNSDGSIVISNSATASASGVTLSITSPGEPKGGTLVIAGSDFGTNISSITVVRICASDGTSQVNATTLSNLSDTSITATWNGTESGYSTFSGVYYVEIVKSGLTSNRFNSTKSFSNDPTISSVTGTGEEGDNVTVTASNLGSYGGSVAGGGQDSNTKLLLNFDRTGGTDIEDSSNTGGEGHKVIANGNAVIKASPFGDGKSAMFFDGTNNYLSIPASSDLALGTGDFTIEAWVYSTDWSHASYINLFDFRNGDQDTDAFWLGFEGTEYFSTDGRLYMYHNGVRHLDSDNAVFPTNEWHHLAVTRVGATITAYVDGVATGTTYNIGSTTDLSGQNPVYIGRYFSSNQYHFKGYLDEIRIVKGTAVYTSNFTVPTSRLTAITNTKLLIHSDQNVDSSDFNHPSTQHDGAIPALVGSQSAWKFDGASDRITFPQYSNAFNLGNGAFTVEAYINFINLPTTSGSARFHPIYRIGGVGGNNLNLVDLMNNSGTYQLRYHDNVTGSVSVDWSTPSTGTWYHFAVTRNGAEVKFYIDGSQVGSTQTINASTPIDAEAGPLQIGGDSYDSRWFDGYIQNFRLTSMLVYTGNFTKPTQSINLTKTWSASSPAGYTVSEITSGVVVANTTSSNVKLLVHGDGAKFTDSSSGTTHTITATGAYHSQGHGGIAPAMAWPSSLKKTGSAGGYFDGSDDALSITNLSSISGDFTVDFWIWPDKSDDSETISIFYDGRDSSNSNGFALSFVKSTGRLKFYNASGSASYIIDEPTDRYLSFYQWNHVAFVRSSNTLQLYVDGQVSSTTASFSANFTSTTGMLGRFRGASSHEFKGYIDSFRIINSAEYTSNFTPPTKIYGAMFPTNPSVGTITITGATTDSTDIAFTEINSSLPNGLTLNDQGAGDQTATITGTLTDVVGSDTTTSNIRIQAKANNDANRITEVNESSGVGAVSITKKSGGKPILFNARRFAATGTVRTINGFGFQPDLIWIKARDRATNHYIQDSLRGAQNLLITNDVNAEFVNDRIDGFVSDGVKITNDDEFNKGTGDHSAIAWGWKAGGSPSANGKKIVDGVESSITSGASADYYNLTNVKQSINTLGDFSITQYTGSSSDGWFKHGLSGKPDWIIVKRLGQANSWPVWHSGFGGSGGTGEWILLDSNQQKGYWNEGSNGTAWNMFGTIDNTKINVMTSSSVNSAYAHICYAWKAVSGVSAFGSYTGTGTGGFESNGNGGVNDMGFKPRWLMVKRITSGDSWTILDSFRESTTEKTTALFANTSNTDTSSSTYGITFTTTGFTMDSGSTSGHINADGQTYIYHAFA